MTREPYCPLCASVDVVPYGAPGHAKALRQCNGCQMIGTPTVMTREVIEL